MNERIRELYLQAHTTRRYDGDPALDGNPPTVYWQGEVSAQRFAELILKECFQYLENEEDRLWDLSEKEEDGIFQSNFEICAEKCRDVRQGLKDHFGVEE